MAINTEYTIKTISNANAIYQSFKKAKQGTSWKGSIQKYEINLLLNIYDTKQKLENGTYKAGQFVEFPLKERGKTRWIKSMHIRDRVVQRALCDYVLLPATKKYYIYDNGASLKGKGLDFARNRLEEHLRQFYNTYHTNEGYIVLIDFSKYFDNIPHQETIKLLTKGIYDKQLIKLIEYLISLFKVNIGGLPKELQFKYQKQIFNSLEYSNYLHNNFNKQAPIKLLNKSVGIGSQISQIIGILYPTVIDNFFKIVKSCKWYARYMDDTYIIVKTLDEAIGLLNDTYRLTKDYGIFINEKKTQIIKISNGFTFLKVKYRLTKTGKIIKILSQDTIIRERRKLKKLAIKLNNKELVYEDIRMSFASHLGRLKQYNNYWAVQNMQKLHDTLFIANWHY